MTKVSNSPNEGNLFTDIRDAWRGARDFFSTSEEKRAESMYRLSNPNTGLDEWRGGAIVILYLAAALLSYRNGIIIFKSYQPVSGFWGAVLTAVLFIVFFEVLKIALGRLAARSLAFGWIFRLRARSAVYVVALAVSGFCFWQSYKISTAGTAQTNVAEILARERPTTDLSAVERVDAEKQALAAQQNTLLGEKVRTNTGKEFIRDRSLKLANKNADVLAEKEKQKSALLQMAADEQRRKEEVINTVAQTVGKMTGSFGNILEVVQILLLAFIAVCERSLADMKPAPVTKQAFVEAAKSHYPFWKGKPDEVVDTAIEKVLKKAERTRAENPTFTPTLDDFSNEVKKALVMNGEYEGTAWGKA